MRTAAFGSLSLREILGLYFDMYLGLCGVIHVGECLQAHVECHACNRNKKHRNVVGGTSHEHVGHDSV